MDKTTELVLAGIIGATGIHWTVVLNFAIANRLSPALVKVPIQPLLIASISTGFGIILLPLINPFGEPLTVTISYVLTALGNGLVHMLLRKNS